MNVLLVEDSEVSRTALQHMLERRGHEVTACPDAESALVAFERRSAPLVLVDLGLPGMDGFELCRHLRMMRRREPSFIIAITGRDTVEDIRRVLEAGADDYIAKPVPSAILDVRLSVADWHLRRRQEVSEQQDELLLLKTLKAMQDAPDVVAMLGHALRLGQQASWVAAHAWTLNEKEARFEGRCGWVRNGEGIEEFGCMTSGPETGLPERAWRTGALTWCHADSDADFAAAGIARRLQVRQAVAIPVVLEGRVIAVLEFFLRESRAHDERMLTMLEAVAVDLATEMRHRRNLRALTRLERRDEVILQSVTEGIFGLDCRGRMTFINPAAVRMLGWSESDLLGQDLHERIRLLDAMGHPVPADACPVREALCGACQASGRVTIATRHGPLPVDYWCKPVCEQGSSMGSIVTFVPLRTMGSVVLPDE